MGGGAGARLSALEHFLDFVFGKADLDRPAAAASAAYKRFAEGQNLGRKAIHSSFFKSNEGTRGRRRAGARLSALEHFLDFIFGKADLDRPAAAASAAYKRFAEGQNLGRKAIHSSFFKSNEGTHGRQRGGKVKRA